MSDHSTLEDFVRRAQGSIEFQDELVPVGSDTADIARFAGERGYRFTAAELDAFIEQVLERELTEEEKAAYAAHKRALSEGLLRGPTRSAEGSEARIRELRFEPGFSLDRDALFAGEIHLVRGGRALTRMVERMRSNLARVFAPHDVRTAHEALDDEAYSRLVFKGDELLREDPEIGGMLVELLLELGLDPARVRHEWPGVRVLPPRREGRVPGYARSVQTIVLNYHRDTWYGGPFHQINLWAPLYPYAEGAGVKFLPRYFAKSLANNTRGATSWRATVGLCLRPVCLEPIDESSCYFPDLSPGDLVCFSSNHLHGSGVNEGAHARINMEIRLVHDDDARDGRRALNVDHLGYGEISRGWHRLGRPT